MLRDKFKDEAYFVKTTNFVARNIDNGRKELLDNNNTYPGKYYPMANGIYIYKEHTQLAYLSKN